MELWVEGPSIKRWKGLPFQYNLTFYEHPINEELRKHQENISLLLEVPKNLSLPFLEYNISLTPCNESTKVLLDDAFLQKVLVNTSYHRLHPYTKYSLTVKACTIVGCGNSSSHFHFVTDEEVPTCAPTVTSAINSSSTNLHVTWLPPELACSNGIISNYSVVAVDMETLLNTTLYTNFSNITISSLKKYHKYCVIVAAATYKGFGNYSDSQCNLTDEDGKFVKILYITS